MVSSRKHVLVVGKYFPPYRGGVEQYTADVVRIAAKKYRVTVLVHSSGPNDEIEHDGNVTIIRCGTRWTVKSQPISPSMWGHLRRLKPDLVHFNAPNFWAAAALNVVGPKCPIVITHHCDVFGRPLLKRLVMPFYRRLVRRSSALIVTSAKNVGVSTDLPASIPRVVPIPCGVDDSRYSTAIGTLPAERESRFGGAPVIGFVGRFVRYKGLSVLIAALAKVDDVHAVLIGEGDLKETLQREIEAAGLGHRVHLLGNLDEASKIREMQLMDLLVLPSIETSEAFGIVQVEAQLLSKPIVASDLPTGVTDVTINEITGLLVPPGDVDALAAAIRRLTHDKALSKKFGAAGRERSLKNFTTKIFEGHFERLFAQVLEPAL
jgi:rhamnosyl/mannosyltransferase